MIKHLMIDLLTWLMVFICVFIASIMLMGFWFTLLTWLVAAFLTIKHYNKEL